jgi:hypothetical protein
VQISTIIYSIKISGDLPRSLGRGLLKEQESALAKNIENLDLILANANLVFHICHDPSSGFDSHRPVSSTREHAPLADQNLS